MSNFKYYCGGEAEQFSFFRIPRALIHDKRFQDLTTEAKLLYALMLDRMGLSLQSGWLDENNRVFIYYTVREVEETLSCGHNKAVRLLAELEQFGLIERVKQGQGRPTKIYIKNFITADSDKCDKEAEAEVEKSDLKEFETETCGVPVPKPLDCPKGERNYTEKNYNEFIYINPSINPPIVPVAPVQPNLSPSISEESGHSSIGVHVDAASLGVRTNNEYVLPLEPEAKQRGERIFDCTIPVSGEPTTLIITGTSVQPSGWMTDNASVLKVDRSGNLTPVSTGTAHITAFVGDAKVKCIIRVR